MASLFQEMRARLNQTRLAPLQKKLVDSTCKTFIFPCSFLTAIINTNAGLKDVGEDRKKFYQWESILSGNESTYLNWDNSTLLEAIDSDKVDGENTSHWKVTLQKGDFFKGKIIDESGDTTFGTTDFGTFGTFTNISQDNVIQVQTTKRVDLTMLTKFYLIPNRFGEDYDDNSIFFISGFNNYRDSFGKFIYAEIVFTALKQELSQSGQAIQQKIYFASPGGGYSYPKINPNNSDFDIHPEYAKDNGVRSIQFEVVGNAAICGVEVYGMPIKELGKANNSIYAPRKLFIQDFKLPVQDDFLQVSSADNQFYYTDVDLDVTTTFDSWITRRKDIVGDKQMSYNAIIETSLKETQESNNSNLTISDTGNTVPNDLLNKVGVSGKVNTQPSNWFFDGYYTDSTGKEVAGIGYEYLDLLSLEMQGFKDILNLITCATNWINQLPYTTSYKVSWSLRDFWLVGGFLNKIVFGFPIYWRNVYHDTNTLYPSLEKLPMMVNKSMYDFFTSVAFASGTKEGELTPGKIPLDVFQKAESSILGTVFGSEATTTSLHFTLTDKVRLAKWDRDKKTELGYIDGSTVMINQEYQNGDVKEYFKVGPKTYGLGAQTEVAPYTDIQGVGSYIICGYGLRMLGDGDIRVTMYNSDIDAIPENSSIRDFIVYQEVIKSESGYRNSQPREWFTYHKTNFIEALDKTHREFHWPLPFPQPKPNTHLPTIPVIVPQQMSLYHEDSGKLGGGTKTKTWDNTTHLFYDFAQQGFTTSDQVRHGYDLIIIPANILSNYVEINRWYATGEKARILDSKTLKSSNLTISLQNVGDSLAEGFTWPNDNSFSYNDGGRVSDITNNFHGIFWFQDAKLMVTYGGNYVGHLANEGVEPENYGSAETCNIEGGTCSITPTIPA